MQDVLKKYKDPHIYTAFIKYFSLIVKNDQLTNCYITQFQIYVYIKMCQVLPERVA